MDILSNTRNTFRRLLSYPVRRPPFFVPPNDMDSLATPQPRGKDAQVWNPIPAERWSPRGQPGHGARGTLFSRRQGVHHRRSPHCPPPLHQGRVLSLLILLGYCGMLMSSCEFSCFSYLRVMIAESLNMFLCCGGQLGIYIYFVVFFVRHVVMLLRLGGT